MNQNNGFLSLNKDTKQYRKEIKLGQKLRHFRWKFKHKHNIKNTKVSKFDRYFPRKINFGKDFLWTEISRLL